MRRIALLIALCAVSANAHAEVVASCGALKGHAYFVPKGLMPQGESGWSEDGISSGSFQLIRAGEDWDIIYTDATGGTVSSRGDGARVSAFTTEDGDVVVQIIHGRSLETYVFWLSLAKPIATFSQAKFATLIPKHALMVSACRRGS